MTDNVVSGTPAPGGSLYRFNIEDKPSPNLRSSEDSLGFPSIDTSEMGVDIPGGLMTCFQPDDSGSAKLDSATEGKSILGD